MQPCVMLHGCFNASDVLRATGEKLPDERMRSQPIPSIASVLARGEPRAAAEWIMQKQPGSDITWLLNSWVRNAPKDVLAWPRTYRTAKLGVRRRWRLPRT